MDTADITAILGVWFEGKEPDPFVRMRVWDYKMILQEIDSPKRPELFRFRMVYVSMLPDVVSVTKVGRGSRMPKVRSNNEGGYYASETRLTGRFWRKLCAAFPSLSASPEPVLIDSLMQIVLEVDQIDFAKMKLLF